MTDRYDDRKMSPPITNKLSVTFDTSSNAEVSITKDTTGNSSIDSHSTNDSENEKVTDDQYDLTDVPNKKKEGVSGHSSGNNKMQKASDINFPKYEKDEESEMFIKEAIRGNEFLKDGLFSCKDVIQAVIDAMYVKNVPAGTHVIREGEIGKYFKHKISGKPKHQFLLFLTTKWGITEKQLIL